MLVLRNDVARSARPSVKRLCADITVDLSLEDFTQARLETWVRVDALTEAEIDTSDIPPITDEQFSRSYWRKPIESDEPLVEDEMRPEYDLKSLRARKLGPGLKSFGASLGD